MVDSVESYMDAGILWVPPWHVQWELWKSQALTWSVCDVWDQGMVVVIIFWMQEYAMIRNISLMRIQSKIPKIRAL